MQNKMSVRAFLIFIHFLITNGDQKLLFSCIFCVILLIWSHILKVEKQQVMHVPTALIIIR